MSENGALSRRQAAFTGQYALSAPCQATAPSAWFSRYCSVFSGRKPVVLYIESTGAKLRAPQNLFVSPDAGIGGYPFGYAGREECCVEISKSRSPQSSCFFRILLFLVGQRRRVLIELRHYTT